MAASEIHPHVHEVAEDVAYLAHAADGEFQARWCSEAIATAAAYWTQRRLAEFADGKTLRLHPVRAAPLLRALGLLHRDGSMPPTQVRKYWQACHMVNLLAGPLRELVAAHPVVRILDVGCGRGYLTTILAWLAKHEWQHSVQVLGIDRNAQVVAEAQRRVQVLGLEAQLQFAQANIDACDAAALWAQTFAAAAAAQPAPATAAFALHGVIALHACDRASCAALAFGVRARARLLAVAPCCQAELAAQWATLDAQAAPSAFAPIWGMPYLRRETAADLTDALRVLALRASGYQVSAIEFVPSPHTRKNTLLKAVRCSDIEVAACAAARAEYQALVHATGGADIAIGAALFGG